MLNSINKDVDTVLIIKEKGESLWDGESVNQKKPIAMKK